MSVWWTGRVNRMKNYKIPLNEEFDNQMDELKKQSEGWTVQE